MTITTLYVDVENLTENARKIITSTIEQWPAQFPKPNIMQLYVKADQTHLWNIWASHKFPLITIATKGVQRYSSITKNSADMSLILDAFADLLKGRASHIAILSDDSDYVALFTAIKQEMPQDDKNELPFVWLLTDRPDTHSRALNDFLPPHYLHSIACSENKTPITVEIKKKIIENNGQVAVRTKEKAINANHQLEYELVAKAIIQQITVGSFRSTDCMKIVKRQFPNNHLSKTDNATFGNQFAKNIWPILEKSGVRLPNPEKKPRKYEMTEEAKNSVGAA